MTHGPTKTPGLLYEAYQIAMLILFWPKTKQAPYKWPWWRIAWNAPFMTACVILLYSCAIACGLLTLCCQPKRALNTFDRIRDA